MKINIFNSNLINTYKITEIEIYKPNNKGLSWVAANCNAWQLGGTGSYRCLEGWTHFDHLPLEIKQEVIKAGDDIACFDLERWNIEIE